jgi:hypothetical protein
VIVIKLSELEVQQLAEDIAHAATTGLPVRVAVDSIDVAFKFKLGGGTWSPPMGKWES